MNRLVRKTLRLLGFASSTGQSVRRCEPEKARIMVLAPHMDDEVLGCGGTVQGREIEIQGDQPDRVRKYFEKLGYVLAGP